MSSSTASKTFGRKLGYSISAAVSGVVLYLVNVSPGWEAAPFLTGEAAEVVPLFNLSLVAGIVLNLLYAVYDPPPIKYLGEVVTTAVSLAVLLRLLDLFPFDLPDAEGWEASLRLSLVLAAVCVAIALAVQVLKPVRVLLSGRREIPDSDGEALGVRGPGEPEDAAGLSPGDDLSGADQDEKGGTGPRSGPR